MKRLRHVVSLLAWSLSLACGAPTTAPHGPDAATPAFDRGASPNAACYPVRFRSVSEGFVDPLTVAGTFTGDVHGSFVVQLDPSTLKVVGKTARFAGSGTFTITGGLLPVPLPLTFAATFDQKNLLHDTPVSPATIADQLVTFRSTSGVTRANLTMHGSFDGVTETVDHDWWGVICP